MSRPFWYGPDGKPISAEQADALLRDDLARRVAHTTIVTDRGTITVSTVFLVLDHSHSGGPPLLWETMVFGGPEDQYQRRCSSRADAERGHAEAVAYVRTALDAEGTALIAIDTFTPTDVVLDANEIPSLKRIPAKDGT